MTEIDTLWDYSNPALSESRFRHALETATGSESHEIATQLARSMGLQGRFDDGHSVLDAVSPVTDRVVIRTDLERGRLFNSAGDALSAVPLFQRAADRALACGDIGLELDALHMLAIADSTRAGDWNLFALSRAEVSDDPAAKIWIGSLLNNYGWTLFDRGDLAGALELFEQAVVIRQEQGVAEPIAIAKWCVARTYRELGRYDEAIEIQLRLAASNPVPDRFVFEELAELYSAVGLTQESERWRKLIQ